MGKSQILKKKNLIFLKWARPNLAQLRGMGWDGLNRAQLHGMGQACVNSDVHYSHVAWTVEAWQGRKNKAREKWRGEGLICGGCCRWWSCWRRQAAALVVLLAVRGGPRWLCFFSSLSLSSVFRSLMCFFFFFFSFSIPLLFCSLSLSSLFLSFFPSLCSFFPYFCRQKTGEKEDRAAIVLPPLQHVERFGQVGVLGRRLFDTLEKEKSVKTKEEKSFSSPISRI